MNGYQNILVPLDIFSDYNKVLDRALSIAQKPEQVSLVYVTFPHVYFESYGFGLGELDKAVASSASIRYNLLQGMSHALNDADKFLLNLNKMSAAQRLSSFLLDLSSRFEKRGLSSNVFDLSMTRVDIANYLGMAFVVIHSMPF